MSFEKFQMKKLDDGHFEIVEMTPTPLGVITSERMAQRFIDYLNLIDDIDRLDDGEGEGVDLVEDFIDDTPKALSLPIAESDEDGETDGDDGDQKGAQETPLQEAFRRIAEGEPVGTVADDVGIPMPKLRGRWAAHVKKQKAEESVAAPPPPKVSAVLGQQAPCRICSRQHTVTLKGDGLCARCTKDVGGL